jgi:threonine dehydrogenase-like Zn-dependent dehydrogenase
MRGELPTRIIRWRVSGGQLRPREEAAHEPLAGQVVLAIDGCALGASEIAELGREGACPGSAAVGTVIAAADDAAEWVGQRMLMCEALPCGQCPVCQRGRGPACPEAVRPGRNADGALASHVTLPVRYLAALSGDLAPPADVPPWRLAALAGPVARAYHAIVRAGLGPGDVAVFLGRTAEAVSGMELARLCAAHPVVVTVDEATPERIRAVLGEQTARAWRVFETTRRPAGLRRALELVRPTGTLSLLGDEADELPLLRRPLLEVPVLATAAPHPDLLPELAALAIRGDVPLEPLTGARAVGPAELDEAIAALLVGAHVLCPIFSPGGAA